VGIVCILYNTNPVGLTCSYVIFSKKRRTIFENQAKYTAPNKERLCTSNDVQGEGVQWVI